MKSKRDFFWTNMVTFSSADRGEQRGLIYINVKER